MKRAFFKWSKRIAKLFLLWFLFHEAVIIFDGISSKTEKCEYGIVFGNTVNKDGTPSKRLQARLDKAIELYNQKRVDKLFVSGGFGKEGYCEGDKMAEYLQENGVPPDDISIDNKGNNSRLTALHFTQHHPSAESVVIISQFYHISRSKLALKQVGITTVYGESPNYYEGRDLYSLFREFFGYYKYLLIY